MKSRVHKICEVISCNEIAENTFLLKFICPDIAQIAKPGQFLNILVSNYGTGPLLRRPFSISNVDNDKIELIFSVVGSGTKILSQKRTGNEIDVIGPLGNHFSIDDSFEAAFIVAGGVGIAPFPFLTSKLKEKNKTIKTFAGFRNAKSIYIKGLVNVLLSTDDGSQGFKGKVTELFVEELKDGKKAKAKIFACGPVAMLKEVGRVAKDFGILCEVSLENFMACGLGVCQGCPVELSNGNAKYALVCKDGPVFDINNIILH